MQNITTTFLKCAGDPTLFGVFDPTYAPHLLLYSYIPIIIASIMLVFLILLKNGIKKDGLLLSAIIFSFVFWVINIIITWLAVPVLVNNFSWQIIALFEIPIFMFTVLFVADFIGKKLNLIEKIVIFIPYIIVLFLLPTKLNILSYDVVNCEANIGNLWKFIYFIEPIYAVLILSFLIRMPKKITQNILLIISAAIFLIVFWVSNFWGEITKFYEFNLIGPLGVLIFISFLTFLIVRFKAFDVKLIGSQALVWALIIIIGSEFFFIQNNTNRILTAITLVISAIVGLIIVRSVKKEIAQKEHIEKIAGELKIANEGQENLIHIMNHQIKGFLGKARYIFAEFLEGDTFGKMPEEAAPALKEGLRATTEGVNYVTEILRGSNASKGTLLFDMKPMDAKVITEELMSEMQPLANEWKVALEGTIAPGEYQIIGDHTQLKEAFKNLITNAIRYNDPDYEHKSVKVSLSKSNDKVLFSVRDTGKGIAPEDKARLFTPGGLGKNSLKQNADATGFGLSFVKGCVLNHNGVVDYKSNSPEKGTTFFIELPINQSSKV